MFHTNTNKESYLGSKVIGVLVFFIAVSLLTISCEQHTPNQLSKEKKAAISDTLRAFVKDVNATWENLDAEAYIDHFSEDAKFIYQGSVMKYAELQKLTENYMAGLQEVDINMGDLNVKVLNPDVALITYDYQSAMTRSNGDNTNLRAIISGTLERINGEWKIIRAHETMIKG